MWIFWGAVLGGLGVALGAFGAHVLPARLAALGWSPDEIARRAQIFETAVRYQMYHGLALVALGLLATRISSPWLAASGWTMLAGVLIFSGLLYALVFAGAQWRWLGAVVPIGGMLLIIGWALLAVAAWKVWDAGSGG